MSYRKMLRQRCDHKRETTTIGSRGQTDVTISTIESNIRCSIQINAMMREEYEAGVGGERSKTAYMGYFEYGKDIREGDIMSMRGSDTREFHVDRSPIVDTVGRKHHLEVDLEII